MKPPVKITLSAVVVVATLIALPYLLIFYRPSSPDQLLGQVFDPESASAPQQASNLTFNHPLNLKLPHHYIQLYNPHTTVCNSAVSVTSVQTLQSETDLPLPANLHSKSASSNDKVKSTLASSNESVQITPTSPDGTGKSSNETEALRAMLEQAATGDKTVIIMTLNQAWTKPGAMLDVFLDSFHRGEGTQQLLRHLVMVALDQQSLQRCQQVHAHCFRLTTDGVDFSGSKGFMTADFLKMMWRRMELLRTILELGYNFIFTDGDILWLRNPLEHFFNDADFEISCDTNHGNAWSYWNQVNCGFQYARSNERTIAMYRHWCIGGENNPHIDEQSLLTKMLHMKAFVAYKVRIRFLSAEQFSGFCNGSKNMSRVVTMHANCCTGLDNKIKDLRKALKVWEHGKSNPGIIVKKPEQLWHVPDACLNSVRPSPPPPSKIII